MAGRDEIVRRVYMVFQDRNWTARPWDISREIMDVRADSFDISFTARGTSDASGLSWDGRLTGEADGTIRYRVDGRAERPFVRNRLGLCVLHPATAAGCPCTVEAVDGRVVPSAFPTAISPHQPFLDVRAIRHEYAAGRWATVRLEGETFETEDHRNWSDASYKTYATPLSLPFPVEVAAGSRLVQSATITVDNPPSAAAPPEGATVVTVAADAPVHALPRIGLQTAGDGHPLTDREAALIRELPLDPLRVALDLDRADAHAALEEAARQAHAVGARLRVALHIGANGVAPLSEVAAATRDQVDCWLVFRHGEKVTNAAWIARAREVLGPSATVGGGTDLYFTELNREPPDASLLDVVTFSLNPQVHASDDRTVVQNLAAQATIAENAVRLCGPARVSVGPITLRPRFNPNATDPELDDRSGPLPSSVDARQATWFAAAWTAISIKYLSEPGTVDALTYYETTGWRGVVERDPASPWPDDVGSRPGEPLPVWQVFADLVGFDRVRTCTSSRPQSVDALLLVGPESERLLVANFTGDRADVRVEGLRGGTRELSVPADSLLRHDVPSSP